MERSLLLGHTVPDSITSPRSDKKPTILVVDDDENLLVNLGAFLESHGFRATCVTTVPVALLEVERHDIDVALIDYRLGQQNGIELVQQIRRRKPFLPLVFMSAYLDEWLEALVQAQQPLRCLSKPFTGGEMLDAIESTRKVCRLMQQLGDVNGGSMA